MTIVEELELNLFEIKFPDQAKAVRAILKTTKVSTADLFNMLNSLKRMKGEYPDEASTIDTLINKVELRFKKQKVR